MSALADAIAADGRSKAEIARAAQTHEVTVHKLVSGAVKAPDFRLAMALAATLGKSMAELFGGVSAAGLPGGSDHPFDRIAESRGWNGVDMAAETGVSQAMLSNIKAGRKSISVVKLAAIANQADVSLDALAGALAATELPPRRYHADGPPPKKSVYAILAEVETSPETWRKAVRGRGQDAPVNYAMRWESHHRGPILSVNDHDVVRLHPQAAPAVEVEFFERRDPELARRVRDALDNVKYGFESERTSKRREETEE